MGDPDLSCDLSFIAGLSSQYINEHNRVLQTLPNCIHQSYDCTRHAAYIVFASIIIAMVSDYCCCCDLANRRG